MAAKVPAQRKRPRLSIGARTRRGPSTNASVRRYRELLDNLNAVVWEADPQTQCFTFVSRGAEALLGVPAERWVEEPNFLMRHVHPEDVQYLQSRYAAASAVGEDHESEFRLLAPDGRVVWVHSKSRMDRDGYGHPFRIRGTMIDISVRKRVEEDRTRLTTVLEATTDLVTVSACGRILYLNRAARGMLGIPDSQNLSGMDLAALLPPAAQAVILREAVPTAIREGVWRGETELISTDGRQVLVSQVVVAHRAADGQIDSFASIARDISEQKLAERRMAGLLELVKDISGTLQLDEILDRVQRRTAVLLPCDRVVTYYWDPRRGTFHDIARYGIPPELETDAKAVEFAPGVPIIDAVVAGQAVMINDPVDQPWLPPAVLQYFGVRSLIAAPLAVRGRVLGAFVAINAESESSFTIAQAQLLDSIALHVGLAIEAAELHRAQREEAQTAAALARVGRELISALDAPVILHRLCELTTEVLGCDCSHTLLWRADEQVYTPVAGYGDSPEDWETTRLLKVPREAVAGLINRLRTEEVVEVIAPPAECLSAQRGITASLYVVLRRGTDVIGYHAARYRSRNASFTAQQQRILTGIAQLASLALENARLVDELDGASRLKSDFVATMSHELRSPLNVIVGYNDLLLDGAFGAVNEEQADTMRRIGKSATELLELINATLDVSRLEAGRVALDIQDVGVAALLQEIDTETRSWRERSGLQFSWKVATELPCLRTDPLKLKVVLKNLIGNAIKFTESGSVTVGVWGDLGHVEFAVADTGIGIPVAARAMIFEAFRQVDSSMTRRYGGVGLGLYIVRRLLDMLGGTVSVQSEVGKGSTFRIRVPTAPRGMVDAVNPSQT